MTFKKQCRTAPFLMIAALLLLAGCSGVETAAPQTNPRHDGVRRSQERHSIVGDGGLTLFNSRAKKGEGGGGIGVNSFLWRASLDSISFMPIASADPFGGVIITDWYSPPESPDERFKVNIFILSKSLRSDGVRATVFRQAFDEASKTWRDTTVEKNTPLKMENAILDKARELRSRQLAEDDN